VTSFFIQKICCTAVFLMVGEWISDEELTYRSIFGASVRRHMDVAAMGEDLAVKDEAVTTNDQQKDMIVASDFLTLQRACLQPMIAWCHSIAAMVERIFPLW